MSNSGSWAIILRQVGATISRSLVWRRVSELSNSDRARLNTNKDILIMLRKMNAESDGGSGAGKSTVLVPKALQESSEELLKLQQKTRRQLLGKWAVDATTPLKLYLVLKGNLPIRNLLFYILAHERDQQDPADLKELCRRYMFNIESLDIDPQEWNKAERGFADWVSGQPTARTLRELAAMLFDDSVDGGGFYAQMMSWNGFPDTKEFKRATYLTMWPCALFS
eukprot:Skav201167  [mRNA]  locus=scaffold65:514679:517956:- [translate_table: standard]